MSDPTLATGEAALGVDLDAIERARAEQRSLLVFAQSNGAQIDADLALAFFDRAQAAEADRDTERQNAERFRNSQYAVEEALIRAMAARDAALARVKELEAGLEPFADVGRRIMTHVPDTTFLAINNPKVAGSMRAVAFKVAARLLAGKDGADG